MANHQVANSQEMNFVDKRRTFKNESAAKQATPANYGSISTMRTRLQAANGAYYTNSRLETMTDNDMAYALRTIDDAAGI